MDMAVMTDPMMAIAPAEPMPAGDPGRVEATLLPWLEQCLKNAEQQTSDVIESTRHIEQVYRGRNKYAALPATQAEELNRRVELNELPDQIDDLAALVYDTMVSGGPLFTASAKAGERQEFVDVVYTAMMESLESTDSLEAIEQAVAYYCKFRVAGLKVVRDTKRTTECRYYEVPEPQAALWARLYPDAEQVPSEMPGVVRFKREEEVERVCFSLQNYNPRNVLVSDALRPIGRQHTIHEAHYWTADEMKDAGFLRLDKLGTPNANGRRNPDPNGRRPDGAPEMTVEFGVYEIFETWASPPWQKWLEAGKYAEADLIEFAKMHQIENEDFRPGRFWRLFHKGKDALLDVTPNYMPRANGIPYFCASFIPADDAYAGQALAERQGEVNAALHVIFNHWLDNIRMRMNQSVFVSSSLPLSDDEWEKIYKPRGRVRIPGNQDPKDSVYPFEPTDLTDTALRAIEFLRTNIKTLGVNDVLQGMASAKTATQDTINNSRGQVKINAAFRRFVRSVLLPALKTLCVSICKTYTVEDFIRVAGEAGAQMADARWSTPEEVEARIDIEPVATFDYSERQQKAQLLTQAVNVFRDSLTPKEKRAMLKLILEYGRFRRSEIDAVTDAEGSATDVMEEIRALIANPHIRVPVRMDDNHALALQMLWQVKQSVPGLAFQPNAMQYEQEHLAALQAQMAAMGPEAGGGDPERRPQEPAGRRFGDPQADTLRQGQAVSPPDRGGNTNAGLTGRAVPSVG